MAKKVFLQDLNEKLLPITRGELVLDSSGKEAFHSSEFLANNSLPGLMSKEDKITLDLIKQQSTPVIFGQDTDTISNWTGVSDQITEYYEGLSIIYVPTKVGLKSSTTLQLNELGAVKVTLLGSSSAFSENMPILLIYINGQWVHKDMDTILTIPNEVFKYRSQLNTVIWFYSDVLNITGFDVKAYAILWVTEDIKMSLNNMEIAIGKFRLNKSPLLINGSGLYQETYIPEGHYIAYYDGETCYINTDGTIPGKIEKAKIAETVEWNIVTEEGTNPDLDDFSTTVDNASYLTIHNLGSADRAPETYKPQAVTAWINQDDMPTQSAYSGLNITSSDPTLLTSWLLCSNASELNYGARLWFRTGIANDWQSWLRVAFANDLLTHGMGVILSANDDVNSLSTGIYSAESEDTAEKIANAPVKESGFKLFTLAGYQSPTSYGSQLAFSKDNFYWRLLGHNNLECSDWYYWLKIKEGESVGTSVTPMYIDDKGVPRLINCSIEKSVPANALFTDTRCMSLNMSLKTEAEPISEEAEVIGVLKADAINASGDGTYLSGILSYVNVPTENFVKKTFKVKQEPVEDPSADGTSTTFIDSISLDENGKITVTKKTVQNTGGGESSNTNVGEGILTINVNGSETQFSANSTENKTVTINTIQSIPIASPTDLGGIKTNYATDYIAKNYKVLVDLSGNAYVNVPWLSGAGSDIKNTAGATHSDEELFIIGSLVQDINPQTYSNANIKISGNAIKASGGFYQESDERLKDFTEDILVDLEQLSQLPKKHFTWKNDSKKETQIGTSAQELQKLYPELVKEDSNGTLSVAYDKLSIIALKAIDELYKRNIELERRIQELENK